MRFLLDENMPRSSFRALMEAGHDVVFAPDDSTLAAQPDAALIDRCNSESRFLITRDVGVSVIAPGLRTGLILVRLKHTAIAIKVTVAVVAAVGTIAEDTLLGAVLVVMPGRTRLAPLRNR